MDKKKIDLNAPAFGQGAQKVEETIEPAVVEPIVAKPDEVIVETPVEESKVPYSRFKKFHDRALEAEAEAEKWRIKAEAIKPETPSVSDPDLPSFWKKLYGDSDESKEAWQIQKQANDDLKKEARREALEAVRNERLEEAQRTEENVEKLDEGFEDLSALVGRDLTDKEQSAVLDIVDEYTPKGDDGNYLGAILPFEKAWEIYEMKQQVAKAPKTEARDKVASLTGTPNQGQPGDPEKDKNFDPRDWNAWKKRL